MRINRKTAVALAASATLMVGSGVVASAAVFGLPVFGFGSEATGSAASPASTTTPPVSVVDQTVYDDHYVTSPGPSGGAVTPKPATAPLFPVGAQVGGQAVSGALAPASSGSAPDPAPTTPAPPASTAPAVTTTTRPPPPAGCHEPEWDPEHRVWQCSNGGD